MNTEPERVAGAMRRINDAWLGKRVDDLTALVHPDIVMVLPGFAGRVQGREAFLAGFQDFCTNATVREFRENEQQIDVFSRTAVVSFGYEMLYQRAGAQYRVAGRDLWVFEKDGSVWIAVWRTMLDIQETAA